MISCKLLSGYNNFILQSYKAVKELNATYRRRRPSWSLTLGFLFSFFVLGVFSAPVDGDVDVGSTHRPHGPVIRGLHSSTFRLNISTFNGSGDALGVCSWGVLGVFDRCQGVFGGM